MANPDFQQFAYGLDWSRDEILAALFKAATRTEYPTLEPPSYDEFYLEINQSYYAKYGEAHDYWPLAWCRLRRNQRTADTHLVAYHRPKLTDFLDDVVVGNGHSWHLPDVELTEELMQEALVDLYNTLLVRGINGPGLLSVKTLKRRYNFKEKTMELEFTIASDIFSSNDTYVVTQSDSWGDYLNKTDLSGFYYEPIDLAAVPA